MKESNNILQVVKSSTKASGAPDAIICDTAKAKHHMLYVNSVVNGHHPKSSK